jgi:hypothetical protein
VRNVRKIARIPGALHVLNGIGRLSRIPGRDQLSGFPSYRRAEVRSGSEKAGSAADAGSGVLPRRFAQTMTHPWLLEAMCFGIGSCCGS